MHLTKTETKILEQFVNNIFLELSINSLARKLKIHYRVARVNVLSLVKKHLLISSDLAGAKIISLNLSNVTLPMYMSYVEEVNTYNRIFKILPQVEDIINKSRQLSPIFCLGIFGSYADNTHKKGSDMDFFIICQQDYVKKYTSLINDFPAIQELVHWNVFAIEEFKEGIKAKGILVYKEIVKNKSIIKGAELFYNIIAEVVTIEQD